MPETIEACCRRCKSPVPGKRRGNVTCDGCRVKGQNKRPSPDRALCFECGSYFKDIPVHLALKHGITSETYLNKYPGAPLGSMSGRKHTDSSKQKLSESKKSSWNSKTEEEKEEFRSILKKTYENGRVPSQYNLGRVFTDEVRLKMSLSKKGRACPTKGIKRDPLPLSVRAKISASLKDRPRTYREGGRDRLLKSLDAARQQGKFKGQGWGQGSYYQSPCQGRVWLRSTSEVQRARELDAEGLLWFYEVESYDLHLSDEKSFYTPDFWVVPGIFRGEEITNPIVFLQNYRGEVRVEEVKGWWGTNHPQYHKIQTFRQQHPNILLDVVVRRGFVWGKPGSPPRDLD